MAVNEIKIINKTDTEPFVKREFAQRMTFEQLSDIMQRNVSKTSSKSYIQYTKELIKSYIANPTANQDTLREVSRFLVRNSMIYKKMIYYYATMPLFLYSVTQCNDLSKSIAVSKSLKEYEEVLRRLNAIDMAKEFYTIIATALRDGIYCGYVYDSEDDGLFIMPLDCKYVRIFGKTSDGQWVAYFDASYFDKGNNKEYVQGIDGTGGTWDDVFVDGYNEYLKDKKQYQWFRLPPEKTLCLISGTDDEFETPLPYFLPLFVSLLDLIDLEQILHSRTELENYVLLVSKLPLIDGSDDVNDFALDLQLARDFNAMLSAAVPDLVGVAFSPMEVDSIEFSKSNSTDDTDKLAQSMNNLFNNAGISQLVVAGGSSTNSIGLTHAIQNDMSNVWTLVGRLQSWLNSWIKNNISDGYEFMFYNISWYNRDTFVSNMKDNFSFGGDKMGYLVCSTGKTPYIVLNDLRFNATVLNIDQWLIPPQTSYTQSGANSDDKGGRPESSDDSISDSGLATRDGNKNDGTTAEV